VNGLSWARGMAGRWSARSPCCSSFRPISRIAPKIAKMMTPARVIVNRGAVARALVETAEALAAQPGGARFWCSIRRRRRGASGFYEKAWLFDCGHHPRLCAQAARRADWHQNLLEANRHTRGAFPVEIGRKWTRIFRITVGLNGELSKRPATDYLFGLSQPFRHEPSRP